MEDCVLVAQRPAAAAVETECREDERPPEPEGDPAQIGLCRTEARELDRLPSRQAGDPLTDEGVRRDDGEQFAVAAKPVRPASRRTIDRSHGVVPGDKSVVQRVAVDRLE